VAIEYDLTLAGQTPVQQLAERALPNPDERPTGTAPFLAVDLDEKYGFDVTVASGADAYINVETDAGVWTWEPAAFAAVSFGMDKFADADWAVTNMIRVVRRVLETGAEDAVLVLNGDVLLLSRLDGRLVLHNRDRWWSYHPGAEEVFSSWQNR